MNVSSRWLRDGAVRRLRGLASAFADPELSLPELVEKFRGDESLCITATTPPESSCDMPLNCQAEFITSLLGRATTRLRAQSIEPLIHRCLRRPEVGRNYIGGIPHRAETLHLLRKLQPLQSPRLVRKTPSVGISTAVRWRWYRVVGVEDDDANELAPDAWRFGSIARTNVHMLLF